MLEGEQAADLQLQTAAIMCSLGKDAKHDPEHIPCSTNSRRGKLNKTRSQKSDSIKNHYIFGNGRMSAFMWHTPGYLRKNFATEKKATTFTELWNPNVSLI